MEQLTEWMRNDKIEATWGLKEKWFTFKEHLELYTSIDLHNFIETDFTYRPRQTNLDKAFTEITDRIKVTGATPALKEILSKYITD